MDSDHWIAVALGIHNVVHAAMKVKYTWIGSGYFGNMIFKLIANHPMYMNNRGGDLAFNSGGGPIPIEDVAIGDTNGNPVAMTGW